MLDVLTDPFELILRYLPDWAPGVIFDVGANVGQSARHYARCFPQARIHSFEPSPESCRILAAKLARFPNVEVHCHALGRSEATLTLTQGRNSTMNRLLAAGEPRPGGGLDVRVRSGSAVMEELGLDHIDFLKIDTEGHDLEVLHGFLPRLGQVDFVEVEAGMNPYNTTHVPFDRLAGFLREAGFHLAHIFQQKMEWKRGGQPVLRRCNPLFVNRRLADLSGIS